MAGFLVSSLAESVSASFKSETDEWFETARLTNPLYQRINSAAVEKRSVTIFFQNIECTPDARAAWKVIFPAVCSVCKQNKLVVSGVILEPYGNGVTILFGACPPPLPPRVNPETPVPKPEDFIVIK